MQTSCDGGGLMGGRSLVLNSAPLGQAQMAADIAQNVSQR